MFYSFYIFLCFFNKSHLKAFFTLFLWISLIGMIEIQAQDAFQKFYHLTRDNGLSQSTVSCITKDSIGFMWFGTNDGLNKYDGYNFTYYKHDSRNSNSISPGRVLALHVDKKGRLWIGTDQGGICLYLSDKDCFQRYIHNLKDTNSISNNDVRDILETIDGKLWIATNGGGVNLFDPEKGTFKKPFSTTDNSISCLTFDNNSNLWIGTSLGGEMLPKGKEKDFMAKASPINFLLGYNIISIFPDSKGIIWFGTYGQGMISYDTKSGLYKYYSTWDLNPKLINHGIIRCLIEDDRGNLLIGTGGGGISALDMNTQKVSFIQSQLNNPYSLNSDIIYCFFRDNEKNIWIGTYNGGVNIIYSAKDKFGHIKSFGGENSLSCNAILSIIEDEYNNLWIGTDGGGLEYFDPKLNTFQHHIHEPENPNSLSGDVVKSLLLDSKGILWIGTFNEGLNSYNTHTKQFKRYYREEGKNSISANHIWDIEEDNKGNIWIATLGGGLDLYDRQKNVFTNYSFNPYNNKSLSNNYVSSITIDKENILWVGTEYGGVNRMSLNNPGVFVAYKKSDTLAGSISSNQISTIFEDSKGRIWIGTIGGGLSLYLKDKNRFVNFTENDGLPNNLVFAILEGENEELWLTTNKGLSKLKLGIGEKINIKIQNFDVNDGLQGNEFSPQAACKTAKGFMYFGGLNGLNYFYPDRLIKNNHIPPVVITDFKIFNQSVNIGKGNSPLIKPISKTDKIVLNYKQSVITFEFAALDYTMPSKNKYKYKLEGFEENWNDVENQRTATYTNLNPGKYIFRVKGSNNDEVWNETGSSIALIIKPPYYKTWIFRLVLLLVTFLLIIIIYKIKLKSLESQKTVLKKMVDERTTELVNLNTLLEKKSREIELQSEVLVHQKEKLISTNTELEKKKDQIELQNIELEKHWHKLEEEVAERTTELEKAKLKAEEADRLKMAFLSNMSHEIRTPMNAIVGFSSLLNDEDNSKNEREDYIRQININSESLLVLIDDILDLSRIEANQLEIKKEVFNLHVFISDLFSHYKQIEELKKDIQFILELSVDNDRLINTDNHRLRQILINLLDNAFKFTSRGSIFLCVNEINGMFDFQVKDTGIGIEKESLKIIFDRFRKGNDFNERIYRGAGLGLTISRRLAQLLGGDLQAESESGKGSIFKLSLPALDNITFKKISDKNKEAKEITDDIDLSNKLILIAEDEKDNYLYLNGLLKRKKAELYWAKDGKQAVELNRIHKFDLILMDIKMPEMSGYDALNIIKQETPSIPIIAQTAFARAEEEKSIRAAGFDDYIAKPIRPAFLFSILKKHL
jgi:signal transduction histidine kinase/ligand-binding sensor domain-containing protein/CheY-like chemotaxis protein